MMKKIYLAGGCFWGIQRYLDQFTGVKETIVGYANGHTENPTYEEVKHEISGHAETVQVTYDENEISLEKLLDYYYLVIDPVSINQQGEDKGISYRTGIYYVDENDLDVIRKVTKQIQEKYDEPLAVEIKPLENFYQAEDYHQKYLEKNPQGYCHIGGCFLHLEDDKND